MERERQFVYKDNKCNLDQSLVDFLKIKANMDTY